MKRQLEQVLLLIICLNLFIGTKSKDLLLHTIQYSLSPEKLLAMATVKFNNELMPAFMILEPNVQGLKDKDEKNAPLVSQQQITQLEKQEQVRTKNMAKAEFHKKLTHPIKVLIHNQDDIQQQCIFDQPWDLCMIQNPGKKKQLDFSIHCLLEDNPSGVKSDTCKGKFTIRQSDLTQIIVDDSKYQEKVKYQSGLFELPQSSKHSVMLISCQDDDLPTFADQLRIFSNAKYHRYERQNSEEIKELVGFDRTLYETQRSTTNAPHNPLTKSSQTALQPTTQIKQPSTQIKKTPTQIKERQFVYLDVHEQMVRKCLQFEFYGSSDLINQRKVFDFVNLTDIEYKNVYKVMRKQLLVQGNQDEVRGNQDDKQAQANNKKAVANQIAQTQPLFKYNPQFTLDIFKPSDTTTTSYDVRLALIDPLTQKNIVSYTFPMPLTTTILSTDLYTKSNHYHFCYVVGREVVKGFRNLQVEIGFKARDVGKGKEGKEDIKMEEQFFFVTLSVQDVQSISVERLATTYLSVKKGEHITFLLQEPYEIDQIKTQANDPSTDLIQILPSPYLQIVLSQHSSDHQHTTECHFSQGCKFQLDVLNECLECKIQYKTSFIKSPNDILMLEIKETIFEGKIDLDEIQYFYKELKPMEIVQLIVNTPNIIIYTLENQQDYQKCKIAKKSCHSQVATSHQRIVLSNPNSSHRQMIFFAIEGLDKTRFSLLFVTSDKIINVMNGMPFTYKLPEKKDQIELLFEVPRFDQTKSYDINLTFNLISPLNSLEMDIVQMKENGSELETVEKAKTMSGFIKLSGKNVKSRRIKILLSKTTHYLSHPVHFTFIVSTSDHKFRLDTGITHYQTLDSAQQKTFIIEFQDQHTYQLNLHIYDTPQKQVSFTVSVFNPNEVVSNSKKTLNYRVSSKEWALVLDDQLVDKWDLCPENDPQCTLFVTLASMMVHQVELAVTLMTQDSVLELKDGVWQTFRLDDLLMRTHFYFTPTHQSNPVKIFFKSSNPQIFVSARLYDKSQTINPAQWPFPQTHGKEQDLQMNQNYMFKSKHLIQVDNEDEEFKKCFPHCVVLMSVIESQQGKRRKKKTQETQKSTQPIAPPTLSILASNNHIQLPQKLRLTLQLKPDQQQIIYIDLKHAFHEHKQTLTFFTDMIVGFAQVYAKVYLPSMQNIPDESDYDWVFGPVKTQLGLMEVRDVFMQGLAWMVDVQSVEEILQKEELYLALFIVGQQATKMTVQYTTDYKQITQLQIDSTQTVSLSANEQKLLQFYPTRDQKIRYIRNKGYPIFHQFKCKAQEGGFDSCLKEWLQRLRAKTEDDIRNIRKERQVEKEILTDSPKITRENTMLQIAALSQQQQQQFSQYQILKKTQTQHVIECQRCIQFIWIYAIEDSELTIQLQSLSTQTLLKENHLLNDYVEPNEYHRYYLSKVQNQFTTIVVSVNQGSPVVTLSDNINFYHTKKGSDVKDDDKKVLLFTVPPAKQLPNNNQLTVPPANELPNNNNQQQKGKSSFNTIFSNLHISITPQDSKPVSYTLSYSSGMHETFLKNGLISTQYLFEKENVTFYYKNQNKQRKSYLTLTVEAPGEQIEKVLEGIEIKMFALETNVEKGVTSKEEIATQQPSTAGGKFKKHTTLTYEIPPVDELQIDIYSQTTTKITIGLTGGQLVFLPMDFQYPIHLQPKQQVKFWVQNLDPGQDIEFIIKKCDQSNPYIFYTLDQKQFENNKFSNYDKFGSNSVFRHVTRAQNKQGLYIKIRADPKQSSTLVIKSSYVLEDEGEFVDIDPGNMGLVQYQFQTLTELAINFEGLQCGKQCAQMTDYYLVRGKTLDSVYKEMVCAGEAVVKLFEKKQGKQDKKSTIQSINSNHKNLNQKIIDSQSTSILSPSTQQITLQKIPQQPSQSNTFHLLIPHQANLPILTIKAVYKPTGQETYYKPVQIKTLQSSVQIYSSRLVMVFTAAIIMGIVATIVATRNLARRGYVHVGQEETMVV